MGATQVRRLSIANESREAAGCADVIMSTLLTIEPFAWPQIVICCSILGEFPRRSVHCKTDLVVIAVSVQRGEGNRGIRHAVSAPAVATALISPQRDIARDNGCIEYGPASVVHLMCVVSFFPVRDGNGEEHNKMMTLRNEKRWQTTEGWASVFEPTLCDIMEVE